jgi:hypothetical protein
MGEFCGEAVKNTLLFRYLVFAGWHTRIRVLGTPLSFPIRQFFGMALRLKARTLRVLWIFMELPLNILKL